jgi:hypothetical protein
MSKPLPPCTCEKPEFMGGEEAWRKGKTNVCQSCGGKVAPPPPPEPPPPPPEPLMRVFKTGRSNTREVTPFRDSDGRLQTTLTSVDTAHAVEVDELIAWCRDNPDMECGDLADLLSEGAFA